MIDVVEILTHLVCGPVAERLAISLGVDRKTLRKYTGPAVAAGMTPGGLPVDEAQWRRLVSEWFPQLVDQRFAAGVVAADRAAPRRREFECHYNDHRPHRTLRQAAPSRPLPHRAPTDIRKIQRPDRIGGLLHEYQQVA